MALRLYSPYFFLVPNSIIHAYLTFLREFYFCYPAPWNFFSKLFPQTNSKDLRTMWEDSLTFCGFWRFKPISLPLYSERFTHWANSTERKLKPSLAWAQSMPCFLREPGKVYQESWHDKAWDATNRSLMTSFSRGPAVSSHTLERMRKKQIDSENSSGEVVTLSSHQQKMAVSSNSGKILRAKLECWALWHGDIMEPWNIQTRVWEHI